MAEVVELDTTRTFMVRRLRQLLDEAERGEVKVVIAAVLYDTGKIGFVHTGALDVGGDNISEYAKVVGMISALHHDVDNTLHGLLDDEGDDDE